MCINHAYIPVSLDREKAGWPTAAEGSEGAGHPPFFQQPEFRAQLSTSCPGQVVALVEDKGGWVLAPAPNALYAFCIKQLLDKMSGVCCLLLSLR